jgi:hypothetical protein
MAGKEVIYMDRILLVVLYDQQIDSAGFSFNALATKTNSTAVSGNL